MGWPLEAAPLLGFPPRTADNIDHSILATTHPRAMAINLVLSKVDDPALLADVDYHHEALDEKGNLCCQKADHAKAWTDWYVKTAAIE